jgi:hypothetical protein
MAPDVYITRSPAATVRHCCDGSLPRVSLTSVARTDLDNLRRLYTEKMPSTSGSDSAICAELPEDIVTLRDGRPLVGGIPGGSRRPARAWPPGASTPLQPNRAVKMATSARAHSGTEATQPPISPAMRCRPGAITETALAAILPPEGPARLSEPVNPVPKPVLTCNPWAGEDETLSRPRNSHKRGHRFHERKSLLTCGAPYGIEP